MDPSKSHEVLNPMGELVSNFGSEHFCPLSLIRVFGTSMVEEYEEIVTPNYPMDYTTRDDKSSKNFLDLCDEGFCPPTCMEPENVTDPTIVVNEQLDVTNYKPIVQLVQEEEEEQPRQSTVTLLETSSETENLSDTPEQNISDNIDIINITTTETFISQEATTFPVESELQETPLASNGKTVDSLSAMEKKKMNWHRGYLSYKWSAKVYNRFLCRTTKLNIRELCQWKPNSWLQPKESVFMRLNTALSHGSKYVTYSRYLEELSQRYRKQMEEMQRAFNKTILKLQNTSRIAEEQDQRQTDAIQLLQAQLLNMSQLVSDLSANVIELKKEVSDRQIYLVASLFLCIILLIIICLQRCRSSLKLSEQDLSKIPKSNNYPSPKRYVLFIPGPAQFQVFSSYDDMNLKRKSLSLIRSQSLHLSNKEVNPDDLYIVEPLKFSPEKKQKKRCKYKSEKVETLKPIDPVKVLHNGDVKAKKPFTNEKDLANIREVYHSSYKGPPSEGSSETSSQSEESYFCGITACTALCNGQLQKTKTEKRAIKRRRSKLQDQGKFIKTLIQTKSGSMPSLQDIIKTKKDLTMGAFGVTTVSGNL
ncbi:hypothetical protein GDO86_007680 [Hymenochirus boettgeri]|uniref:SUN domain-containing ossification factor n=1 Tax=Hymenochirus boettgeri TaxID=247094 RepID=A0A8T2J1Y8_9PIPI|nr:hypothetical protein GDO86_007680 [Hymenochirus boettgeri]